MRNLKYKHLKWKIRQDMNNIFERINGIDNIVQSFILEGRGNTRLSFFSEIIINSLYIIGESQEGQQYGSQVTDDR